MARIRTIKPEFPHSESMGQISRDARLLFILLWTLADDSGRLRGNSRMLASLLFPYDDDAPSLIDGWLTELDKQNCVIRYQAHGSTYVQICNWLIHQKIDKPSKSKIPSFEEGSRILANPRECSSEDQGSRIKDQGRDQGEDRDQGEEARPAAKRATRLSPDAEMSDEWRGFCKTERPDLDPQKVFAKFVDYWAAKPGKHGTKLDWTATWRNWVREERSQRAGFNGGHMNKQAAIEQRNQAAVDEWLAQQGEIHEGD